MATGREELIAENLKSAVGSVNRKSTGEKKNRRTIRYGNLEGEILFGHLHMGSESGTSDVTSGVMLQAFDSRHYISLDNDGPRKGWIFNRCPSTYQIICGTDIKGSLQGGTQFAYMLWAENGDIVIRAENGKIRLSALDIDIRAEAPLNTRGTINLDSNQSVNIKTGTFDVNASTKIRIFTPNVFDIIANTALNFKSNFIGGLSSASAYINKPDKANPVTAIAFAADMLYNPAGILGGF